MRWGAILLLGIIALVGVVAAVGTTVEWIDDLRKPPPAPSHVPRHVRVVDEWIMSRMGVDFPKPTPTRPWLIPVYLTPAAALFFLVRRETARRRYFAGNCPNCGYDLRATRERCPECGAVAAVPRSSR